MAEHRTVILTSAIKCAGVPNGRIPIVVAQQAEQRKFNP